MALGTGVLAPTLQSLCGLFGVCQLGGRGNQASVLEGRSDKAAPKGGEQVVTGERDPLRVAQGWPCSVLRLAAWLWHWHLALSILGSAQQGFCSVNQSFVLMC